MIAFGNSETEKLCDEDVFEDEFFVSGGYISIIMCYACVCIINNYTMACDMFV